MDLDQTLRQKYRSYQQDCKVQIELQKKKDNQQEEFLKKQTQARQSQSLIFSTFKFRRDQFFLKQRLLKIFNLLLKLKKRKNRLRMRQKLKAINEALATLKNNQKTQEEERIDQTNQKTITLFKDLLVEKSHFLKMRSNTYNQSKKPRL